MPDRTARVALVDMRDAMRRIARYTRDKTLSDFRRDTLERVRFGWNRGRAPGH